MSTYPVNETEHKKLVDSIVKLDRVKMNLGGFVGFYEERKLFLEQEYEELKGKLDKQKEYFLSELRKENKNVSIVFSEIKKKNISEDGNLDKYKYDIDKREFVIMDEKGK